ncbi:MAG TPA: zinc ribbon domain-containing protein [Thermoplasmata archaeon]|nr:zinc ribbon domain-containing protein [Thermoplasmata archaeon]
MSGAQETIVEASVARPAARLGPLAVEAPDEDGFSLGVAAAEALPWAPGSAPTRIDLVGDLPPVAEWALAEALGIAPVPVHRTPGGSAHLFEALRSRGDARPGASRLVIAVDMTRAGGPHEPAHGALGLAVRIGAGPGVRVLQVDSRLSAPGGDRESSAGFLPKARGPTPAILIGDDERVAATARALGDLGYVPAVVPRTPPGTGPAPTVPFGLALRAAAPTGSGEAPCALVAVGPDRMVTVELAVSGRIAWSEAPAAPPRILSALPPSEGPGAPDARAEGAYVPKPRYLENLPSRWRLIADRCGKCGSWTFPARGSCRNCGAVAPLQPTPLARSGWVVEACTTVRPGAQPTEFDPFVLRAGAYDVVIARSPEGPRGTFQVAGPPGSAPVGNTVDLVLRRLYPMEGEWRYGRKAVVRQAP